jgi:drug/metabolite transporter (DMT)-like permease
VTPIGYLGIPIALLGAFFLSFGSAVQQRGVAEVGDRTDGKGGLAIKQMIALVANREWLLGTVMVIVAIICQLTALAFSPIAVVQPIGVFALVITAFITSRSTGEKIGAPARRAIAISVGAVIIFVTTASLTTHVAAIRADRVVVVLVVVATFVIVTLVVFLSLRKRLTRIFYVIVSGVLFGFVATLAKVIIGRVETVVQAHHSPFAVGIETYVCLLGIIVAGSLGQYLQQSAFSSGSPEVVVAGLTVIDPIVGASIGLAILGEATSAPLWAFFVFVAMALLAVYGVVQLSRKRPGD